MSILEESPQAISSIPQDYTKRLMVFGGRASMELAARIAGKLDVDLGQADLRTFADGEVYCRYQESIRGADIFLVQSTAANAAEGMTPNDALMELLVMIDAAKGASAHRIIAVMPWYGYSRQDKKSAPREPISARVVAQCLEAVGVDRVLTMDLHSGQVQGFFSKPVDHMTAMPMLTQYFMDQAWDDELVIVSPDAGRVKVARNFARKVGVHWAVMEKERPAQQVAEIGYVVGDVQGKTAVLVDDMIDTAGTLTAAAKTVLDEGAARRDRLRHPRRLLRPRLRAARLRELAASSGSWSPTRSRCAPARPRTSRSSRPRRRSPTRSAASSPTTRSPRSSPARTSSSSGTYTPAAGHALTTLGAGCCGSATRAPTRSCPGTRSRASPPRSRPASTRSSSTCCARAPTSPRRRTGARAPAGPATASGAAARRPRLGRRPPARAADPWRTRSTRSPRPPLDRLRFDLDLKVAGREDEVVAALAERGLTGRAMVSTMELESLVYLRDAGPELDRGWTLPKVSRDWSRSPWLRPVFVAGSASLRTRLPGLVRRRAPELGVWAVWIYHPLIARAWSRARTRSASP